MSFKINSLYLTDGYKLSHKAMLAPGTTKLYGTWIPRSVKHAPKGITKIVSFGQQLVWKWLHDEFEENFFMKNERPYPINFETKAYYNELKRKALQFVKDMSLYLGMEYDGKHFEELWDLGYLPIKVKSLPEGIETDPNIPHMTFINTVDGFAWLTLYLETVVSALAWKPSTAATIAKLYRRQAEEWVSKTDPDNMWLVDFMCHDFSARGLDPMSQYLIGLGHATSFKGSDTLPVIPASRYFYGVKEDETPVFSVNASEHSVSTTKIFTVGEQKMIADWLKIFPKGILSIVSDTFDLWKLITEYLPANKDAIMNRDGKLVIRPDCLDDKSQILTPQGWKYFKDLSKNDLVAQVKENGSYEFVKPLKIINEPYEGDMYEIRDFHGKIDLVVTPNHRLVSYKNLDNSVSIKEASDYKQNYWEYKKLRSPKSQSKGRELTPYERFLIALQADGCIKYVNKDLSTRVEFNFQKEKKHDRLLEILKNTDLEYNVYFAKSRQGQSTFSVLIPYNRMVSKTFNWVDTSYLDSLWAEQFIEELKYWDSSIRNDGRFKYDTTIKENIDVVELVAIAAGKGVYISETKDNRKEHFSNIYTAHIMDNPYVGGQSITKTKIHYKGTIHCVKVPTGMILVKRNQGVCVTGNSGDPVDIICGKIQEAILEEIPQSDGRICLRTTKGLTRPFDKNELSSKKGVIELLWDIFGGTINEQGYKVLDPHIGAIYGDSITPERQRQIYERLAAKGFASTNIVLGVGSFTYGYNTRDTLGFAAKGAWFEVKSCPCGKTFANCDSSKKECKYERKSYNIYKDPVTDDGTKKSLKGMVAVGVEGEVGHENYFVKEECTIGEEEQGLLQTIYEDGKFYNQTTFSEIRERLSKN